MTAPTKRNIEFDIAVLVIAVFVLMGMARLGWWLFCLIRVMLT